MNPSPDSSGGGQHRFQRVPHRGYTLTLATVFAVIWVALAIKPIDRPAWMLENFLLACGMAALFLLRRKMPFSRVSLTLIFVYSALHSIGAHYTYSLVPYDEWSRNWLGFSIDETLGWERNNYDRVIHFLYGFMMAYPIREVFFRVADARGFWGYFLPLDLTMSTSALFELFEWWTAAIFGGDLGQAYLGTQGDEWDCLLYTSPSPRDH
jgi:putative membrane protein